jgi:hypothetical protein
MQKVSEDRDIAKKLEFYNINSADLESFPGTGACA